VTGCDVAILIYPEELTNPIDKKPGSVRIKSLTFALSGDLEKARQRFLNSLDSIGLLS
jgi:5-methylcytosine-specific restriction enzyme subunit McrC